MVAERFLAAGEVGFDRAERLIENRSDLLVREALLVVEVDHVAGVGAEFAQREGEVMAQVGRTVVVVRRGGLGGFVQGECGVLAAAGVAPMVVGDAEQPGRKRGCASKTRQAPVGGEKRVLRQIVGEGGIRADQVAEEVAHRRLVAADEFAKGGAVVALDGAQDQLGVGWRHSLPA